MKSIAPISEQFKNLPKEKQVDVFIEIQQIFLGVDASSKETIDNCLIKGLESDTINISNEYWENKKAKLQEA